MQRASPILLVCGGALAAWGGALALPTPAIAQADLGTLLAERQEAVPRGRHAFQETWLMPARGPDPERNEFAGRVTFYQDGPRERIEIREVENGALEDPIVIVSNGRSYHLVTKVGSTPLMESAPADDPLLRLVLAGPPGDAPQHRTVPVPGGGQATVLRNAIEPDFDSGDAFQLRLPQVGGGLLKSGLSQFSAAQNTQLTASAGARGVDQIRTANGSISVTPDPDAVRWMDEQSVSEVDLEEFKLEVGLAPYDALPAGDAGATGSGGAR
ncbi:MAG: hypothetical protein ACREMD_14360 [Gemmatimonadota bacterium]